MAIDFRTGVRFPSPPPDLRSAIHHELLAAFSCKRPPAVPGGSNNNENTIEIRRLME